MWWSISNSDIPLLAYNSEHEKTGYVYGRYADEFKRWKHSKKTILPSMSERIIKDAAKTTEPRELYSLATLFLNQKKLLVGTKTTHSDGFIPFTEGLPNNVIY